MSGTAIARGFVLDRRSLPQWLLVSVFAGVALGGALTLGLSALLLLAMLMSGEGAVYWRRVRGNPVVWCLAALYLCIVLSALWSPASGAEKWRHIEKYSRLLYLPIAVALLDSPAWRRRALAAFALAMLLTLALSWLHAAWPFAWARATRETLAHSHSIFKTYITQGMMMSLLALLACMLALNGRRVFAREAWSSSAYLWFAVALLAAINITTLLHGRTGQITLVANVLVVFVFGLGGRRRIVFLAAAATVFASLFFTSEQFRTRLNSVSTELQAFREHKAVTSSGERWTYAVVASEIASRGPFYGHGLGSYPAEFCRTIEPKSWCNKGEVRPHNQYLLFAVEQGVFGVAAMLALLVSAGSLALRLGCTDRTMMLGIVVTFAIHSALDSTLWIATEGSFFPLMLGLFAAAASDPHEDWRVLERVAPAPRP
ncbi:MAG: O-antigen ligase family protein [Burkholderiales bacterium]|nr:O-antigen ligase family protein [Burkholderiales bacterium]